VPIIKIYFDYGSLSSCADEDVDYRKSYLEINTQDADVHWHQVLKGQHGLQGERLLLVEGGVVVT
jgi:hypothetical protein